MHRPSSDNLRFNAKGTERPNTLGLESRHLDVLLNHLDSPEGEAKGNSKRSFARWPFRRTAIKITIFHPGGSEVSLRLACRNLSRGGVGVLHTSFLHPGSSCLIELPNTDGSIDRIDGFIARCMHRRGTLHEVGIRFKREVDVSKYVRREADYTPALEHVDPGKLSGSVLCVDPMDVDVELVRAAIRDTHMSLRHVRTGAEANGEDLRKFSVIICERSLPDMFGLDLLRSIREAKIMTPMLMVSRQGWGPGEVTDRLSAWAQKPVDPALMLRIIAELHLSEGQPRQRGAA
jgi:CheY-like chemotaxis protein